MLEKQNHIKFIHTADIHFGAPMLSMNAFDLESRNKWQSIFKNAVYDSFKTSINCAITEGIDFFLIVGDVFDSYNINVQDYKFFVDCLLQLKEENIKVFLCSGNHDPYSSWKQAQMFSQLPDNVYMFRPNNVDGITFQTKDGNDVCVCGQSFEDPSFQETLFCERLNVVLNNLPKTDYTIGLAHTGLDIDLENFPLSISSLEDFGIDYWGLGHIHKRLVMQKKGTTISFPGCIQGLHINAKGVDDEYTKGAFGVNLVTLYKNNFNKTNCDIEFVPCSQVLWKKLDIDVSNCKDVQDVELFINSFIKDLDNKCPYVCYRVNLIGSTSLHKILSQSNILDSIKETLNLENTDYLCEEVISNTQDLYDYEAIFNEDLFGAEVLRQIKYAINEDELEDELIQEANKKSKFRLTSSDFQIKDKKWFINKTRDLVFDELMNNE